MPKRKKQQTIELEFKCEEALQRCGEHCSESRGALDEAEDALRNAGRKKEKAEARAEAEKKQKNLFDLSTFQTDMLSPKEDDMGTDTFTNENAEGTGNDAPRKLKSVYPLFRTDRQILIRISSAALQESKAELQKSKDDFLKAEKEWEDSMKCLKRREKKLEKSIDKAKQKGTHRNKEDLQQAVGAMDEYVPVVKKTTENLWGSIITMQRNIKGFEEKIQGMQKIVGELEKQQQQHQTSIDVFVEGIISTFGFGKYLEKSKSQLNRSRREVSKAIKELAKSEDYVRAMKNKLDANMNKYERVVQPT